MNYKPPEQNMTSRRITVLIFSSLWVALLVAAICVKMLAQDHDTMVGALCTFIPLSAGLFVAVLIDRIFALCDFWKKYLLAANLQVGTPRIKFRKVIFALWSTLLTIAVTYLMYKARV